MKKLFASVTLSLLLTGPVHAQGVPTVDVRNTLQTIKQLEVLLDDLGVQKDMLGRAVEQVQKMQQQLDQLQQIYAKIDGVRDIADLAMGGSMDSILDGNLQNVIGTFRSAAMGDLSGLNGSKSSDMAQTIETVLSGAGLSQADVTAMANSGVPGAERTASQAASGAVLAATSEQSYRESGVALERVDVLMDMALNSKDMKESIDFNTRMLGEIVVLLAKNLEATSIAGAYSGQSGVMEAAAIAQERAYMTFSND